MVEAKEVTYRYRWVIAGVLWSTYVVIFMHRLGMGPLAPFLKQDFGLTSTQVGSLMSAAALGYMLSIMPAGWAVDRVGVRRLLLIGQVGGGVFILGMFWAPSYEAALFIMLMSGFGCGCLMPSTTKGVMVWFPLRERATIMGLKQTGVNVGGIIAAAVLPAVALAVGWRFGFIMLGSLAIIIGITSFILYKEPPAPALSPSRDVTTSAGVARQARGQMLRELFKSRDLWLVAIAGFALAAAEFAVIAHLVLYLTESLLLPVVTAGGILAITETGGILGKPGSGLISDRIFAGSRRKVYLLWGILAGVMCLVIALWGPALSWALYPVLIVLGVAAIGWGGIHLTLVAELAGTELAGTATGATGVAVNAGTMVGPLLFGFIVDTSGSYQQAWLSCVGLSVVCVAAMFFVREERRRA